MRLLTDEQHEYFVRHQKMKSAKDIAEELNKIFGLNLKATQIKSYRGNKGISSGLTGRFEKGQVSWNKGKKFPGRISSTSFKKGNIPNNHRPVGSERVTVDGYIEVKVEEPRIWKLKHNVVWEKEHGKIPKGHCVLFKNQDKSDLRIDNLMLVSRSELAKLNKVGALRDTTPEITEAQITILRIEEKVKKLRKGGIDD